MVAGVGLLFAQAPAFAQAGFFVPAESLDGGTIAALTAMTAAALLCAAAFFVRGMRVRLDKAQSEATLAVVRSERLEAALATKSAEADGLTREFARLSAELGSLLRLMDSLPMPVWRRNSSLAIEYCNRAYAAAVEADPASALVQGRELIPGVTAYDGKSLARAARESGHARSASHHVVIGGARRLLGITEAPLGEDGRLGGYAPWTHTGLEDTQADLARHVAAHAEVLENLSSAIALWRRSAPVLLQCRLRGAGPLRRGVAARGTSLRRGS